MPRRNDIESILVIGSGPIVIGQACEFDYSGTQAVKALKEEGYHVILINSNPATIMTDPDLSDKVYIEPITLPYLEKIIEIEKPDAILPTVGGQTALNAALELHYNGILEKYGVELIGAKAEAIEKAENRDLFKKAMEKIGAKNPKSGLAHSLEEALALLDEIGFPIILRPSFTLGGTGGGVCYNKEDFEKMVLKALSESPNSQVLIEQSVLGWKEYELEVMRDLADNVVIICSIENLDPMGIHTGDSITIAPQQTLSDKEYQNLRDLAIRIIREIGVETGGSNIQFAVNPANGEILVIEMNPRVSRSSALASKATGFPIARIAAKLSVGYTLDEIPNAITKKTPGSFEPTIDYIVTKIPRFTFEKFPESPRKLDTQMRSVGEAMSLGRTFPESFQKAVRSLEIGRFGWGFDSFWDLELDLIRKAKTSDICNVLAEKVSLPTDLRIFYLQCAMMPRGWYESKAIPENVESYFSMDELYSLTKIDPWFLAQLKRIVDAAIQWITLPKKQEEDYANLKSFGFSNHQIAVLNLMHEIRPSLFELATFDKGSTEYVKLEATLKGKIQREEKFVMQKLSQWEIDAVFKRVDTCAAEFESYTPYLYSTYETEDESEISSHKKAIILGGGPNRIGQGIEFDYCCCQAAYALKDIGIESIMINSNPETVSTDFDTSDRLYFEPLTSEDVLRICKQEATQGNFAGVILQFGGQTPLKLAKVLDENSIPILGTSVQDIDRAEDREQFNKLIAKLGLKQPQGAMAASLEEALQAAETIGYPVLARPSYVLGGRAMAIVHTPEQLKEYMKTSTEISKERPALIDQFLERAIEIDVDALCDRETVYIGGILEHIEQAGVHSGDSACYLPPVNLSDEILDKVKAATEKIALELKVLGLMNIQFAVKDGELYVIEVNPRASRTVPFISKATGIPLAKIATRLFFGEKLKDLGLIGYQPPKLVYCKEVVLPFKKFSNVDTILGPEMKSTGEVMGIGQEPEEAFFKAEEAAYSKLPLKGVVFLSVDDASKPDLVEAARIFEQNEFLILATKGTYEYLNKQGISNIQKVNKVHEGSPHIVDKIKSGEVHYIVNIPADVITRNDAFEIRVAALQYNVPYATTVAAAMAAAKGIAQMKQKQIEVYPIG
ncbi:MAG: carbamoyl-phosphate synthase large subunit [Candidatus Hydrogenedentota bacterium]|nr:MAG: carbamoyl-phosphate synthase large subunit [Candidatus Hydrogenedentota bacterium]